ncbi:hypothetical protein HIM_09858 [Hirsutella minnesotensis 3608]|uniref:AMP-dependent synthetase/ligase domain-containing protein n=1 Tax=Hirsutella minnesotensis 3608 TaxID=1043627 RepID=A0A0F7ZKS7_9HYPO|nr:hypothetical protein HIM_09858 [Hirsutella minnesotensis 3608]
MDFEKTPRKLWEHLNPKGTAMWRFMQDANQRHGLSLNSFSDLYQWSCRERSQFYGQLWDSQRWIHEGSYTRVVDESVPISKLPAWFEGVRLNLAENILWSRGRDGCESRSTLGKEDDRVAVTEIREGNTAVVDVTWAELRARVARLADALHARGLREGDRVVMVGAHAAQTLVVFLAVAWLGGIFSSSSTDMGVGGLLQRTVQIDPKFVFFDDGALYNGKVVDLRDKIRGVVDGMKDCKQFETVIVVERFPRRPNDTSAIPRTERLEAFARSATGSTPPIRRIAFQGPAMIFYSSGTTGNPKAIVHGVGPLMMNSTKEARLHLNMTSDDVALQYTTTGWIMYVASVLHLLVSGRAILYDGSPLLPDLGVLLRVVEQQRVTSLGISPRWMTELMKRKIVPRKVADLSSLRVVGSTGMVLPEQMFHWFYDVGFPEAVQLCNFSGGTDIAGCFAVSNPIQPLYAGGCMGGSLGTPIAVFDHGLDEGSRGEPLRAGMPGDLVSPAAFPNVPLFLWGDSAPAPGDKYRSSYFTRFGNAWAQGDFCAVHPRTGAVLMLGRSDGVLNPSGIRFGSSDIYAVVERCFAADVVECLCVGQRRPRDLDERVLLFLIMKPGRALDAELVGRVRETIARELTKRHVPKYIFEVSEIPHTVNGKKVELPVKAIVSGKTVKPSGTLINPQCLEFYYRFQEIEKLSEPQAKL